MAPSPVILVGKVFKAARKFQAARQYQPSLFQKEPITALFRRKGASSPLRATLCFRVDLPDLVIEL
jgi:hypothetical protein